MIGAVERPHGDFTDVPEAAAAWVNDRIEVSHREQRLSIEIKRSRAGDPYWIIYVMHIGCGTGVCFSSAESRHLMEVFQHTPPRLFCGMLQMFITMLEDGKRAGRQDLQTEFRELIRCRAE